MATTVITPISQRPQFSRTVSSTSQLSNKSSTKSRSISRTFSREKDKLRLYLALFPRGGSPGSGGVYGSEISCDSYHWAFVLGPKSPLRSEAGTAYHVSHSSYSFDGRFPLLYDETELSDDSHQSRAILVRIALAKVLDEQRVIALLRSNALKIDGHAHNNNAERRQDSVSSLEVASRSCLSWVKSAWELLASDSQKPLKTYFGPEDWDDIDSRARKYVKRKRQQGRFQPPADGDNVSWNVAEIPTWNFWENRETTD